MKHIGRLVPVSEITPCQRDTMFALMDQYYENMKRTTFESDLAEKQWVMQIVDPRTQEIYGFSTQMLMEAEVDGRPILALYSGDTIVARDHWGSSELVRVWGELALSLVDANPSVDFYWFLISKGYKTYRLLTTFFHEYYPRLDADTPGWARSIIDVLGRNRFRDDYDSRSGVVHAGEGKDRLRPGVADILPERLLDPHTRFFVERNPDHAQGDELCCLAPVTRENFTPAAHQIFGHAIAPLGVH